MRMFFALCAHEGFIALKVDATNAYANSHPADQATFVYIDDQYADWYLARYGVVVSRDMVLLLQHALQGHPESGPLGKIRQQQCDGLSWLRSNDPRTKYLSRNLQRASHAYVPPS